MAKTPFLEKTSSLRGLGALFVALMVFFVWLTFAFFNKTFVDFVPVTLKASNAGLALPSNADVKIQGMIVGEVREKKVVEGGVEMKLGLKPEDIDVIPAGVTAIIVPKTLFGEKYVNLLPPDEPTGEKLQAGDVIDRAEVPVELEDLFNNLYPLLEAVQPAELSYTLSAVSQALDGRGEQLGATLVTANEYLEEINPDVPQLIDDLVKLGTVSDTYAAALPDVGRLLENLVVTGDTVVAKRAQLQAFFSEGAKLGNTATDFLKTNGDNIITLNNEARPVVQVLDNYSKVFPCVLRGLTEITPKLASAFRDNTLHIKLSILAPQDQPSGYDESENGVIPTKEVIDAEPLADPTCRTLPTYPDYERSQPAYTHENKAPTPPFGVYQLVGINDRHQKFRPAAADTALVDLVGPSVNGIDSAAQRQSLKSLLGASLGLEADSVPDVGALLVSPIIRGSEVTFDETR